MRARLGLLMTVAVFQMAAAAPEANFLDRVGRRAYARGHYDAALESFALLQQIAPSPRNLFNMALSAELGGRPKIAHAYWEEYLASGDPDRGRLRDAKRRRKELGKSLAAVRVLSAPPGANIFVDREDLGSHGRTPRTLVLEPGDHRLRLEHETTEPGVVEVHAVSGREIAVDLRLEPLRGELRIVGSPGHGQVIIFDAEGRLARRAALGEQVSLPVGTYRVRLAADGFQDVEETVIVTLGTEERRQLVAPPKPTMAGRLLITAGRESAQIYLDDEPRGTTPAVIEGIAPGRHTLRLEAPGFRPWVRSPRVEAGAVELIQAELERP